MTALTRRRFLANAAAMVASSALLPSRIQGGTVKKFDPERFVEDVRGASAGEGQPAVEELLRRAVSDPRGVVLGLGEPREAGIHTLYHGEDLTVLNVIWAPLMVLLPHNHRMWASIGIYGGREDNIIWENEGPTIEASDAASLSEKEVFGLSDTAIHSVTNPIRRLTGAIHIYGGDFFAPGRSEWDPETLRERPFDLEAARQLFREANERFEAMGQRGNRP